ncbi:MAG: hypothetical protein SGBAC_009996 [Bacillariaceae sp.]
MMLNLARIATPGLHQFSARDIAFILHSLFKKSVRNKAIFETAGKVMLSRFQDFYPKDISMILCACTRLGFKEMSFFNPLADLISPKLGSYESQEISGVICSFTSRRDPRMDLLRDAATAAVGISSTFTSQDMTRLLRSMATVGFWDEKLGDVMAKDAISIMSTFSTLNVAHLAVAYCKQGKRHPELFHAISNHVIQQSHKMKTDDICYIMHAFATLNHGDRAFYDEIASAAILSMDTFKGLHLQSIIHSFSKINYFHAQLFEQVAESSILKMDSLTVPNLKVLIRSFSKLHYNHNELVLEVGQQMVAESGKFNVEILINVLEAFVKLNIKPSMLGELNAKCKNVIPILRISEELSMVKSLSRLQVEGDCIERISQKIYKACPHLTNIELIEVAKTFTIVRYKKNEFWLLLQKEILRRDDSKWTAKELGVLSSAYGPVSSSLCAGPRTEVVSMCFKMFHLKDSSEITIQDVAAVSSAIPFGKRARLFPTGFLGRVTELAISKAPEARPDDVRCMLINLSQIDLPLPSRRRLLGTYRAIFSEVSLFLNSEDCKSITKVYVEMDKMRDDSAWANNFSFLHIAL